MTVFRMLRPEDVPACVSISKVQLGVDYLDEDDFIDAMSDPGQFCMVAEDGGEAAGFAICQVFGPEREGEMLMLPDCPERDAVTGSRLIGLLDSVAVSPDHAGRGIGAAMCSACVEEMSRRGCSMVCAMAWRYVDGHTNIAGILNAFGMRETVAINGYWNRMVDSPEGHQCPICGAPCRCDGVFWYRPL